MARTADDIRADLQALTAELEPVEAKATDLYARRLALYVEARGLDPKPTVKQLAEWAHSTEGAVHQVLGKHQRAQRGDPRRSYGSKTATG